MNGDRGQSILDAFNTAFCRDEGPVHGLLHDSRGRFGIGDIIVQLGFISNDSYDSLMVAVNLDVGHRFSIPDPIDVQMIAVVQQ